MSSRAERNVVAILCLSESLGKTLREHYKKDGRRTSGSSSSSTPRWWTFGNWTNTGW